MYYPIHTYTQLKKKIETTLTQPVAPVDLELYADQATLELMENCLTLPPEC